MQLLEVNKQNYRYERRIEKICYAHLGTNTSSMFIDPINTVSVLFIEHNVVICAPNGRRHWIDRHFNRVEKAIGIPNKIGNVIDYVPRESNITWRLL